MASAVEEARAHYEAAKAEHESLRERTEAAYVAMVTAELALIEAEGRGQTYRAGWIRAWLAGDMAECARLSALMYPAVFRADVAANLALLHRIDGASDGVPREAVEADLAAAEGR